MAAGNHTVPNLGSYNWDPVPGTVLSTACKIKISDPNNANATDTGYGSFPIRGNLTLDTPVGSESWSVGSVRPVNWTRKGNIINVNISYSTDAGSTYPTALATNYNASLGTWNWSISNTTPLTNQGRIKVADASNPPIVFANNTVNFDVTGAVELISPSDAGISIAVGNPYSVNWTKAGAVNDVQLHFSPDGGIAGNGTYSDSDLIGNFSATNYTKSWTVPDRIGSTLRIRVRDLNNTGVWDESNNTFQIRGKVFVVVPNGDEIWYKGDTQQIQWIPTGTYSQVKLEYSTNAFVNETLTYLIANVSAGSSGAVTSYNWTVPDNIGSDLIVRVTDRNNAMVTDVSNNTFNIKGRLHLTSPNGGENWIVNSTQPIYWQRTGSIANVKLEYSTDSGDSYAFVITNSTPAASGEYNWTVPDSIGTNKIKVKVTDASDATVNDDSNATFTIKGALHLSIPNGGESWGVGTKYNITWERTGSIANVTLEYSTDGGGNYTNSINATSGAAGIYEWTIPDNPGSQIKVRIKDTSDASVNDPSDTNFKIVGFLTLTAPDGGEKWVINTTRQINWTMTGSIANVKLEYSTDGSSYDKLINSSVPGGSSPYYWLIPDTASTTALIKVTDASESSVYDTSNNTFKLQVKFNLTQPKGGEVWVVNDTQYINWTTIGTAGTVNLTYSTDSGSNFNYSIANDVPNTGSYSWIVPNNIYQTLRLKVADSQDAEAFNASTSNFKIKGAVSLSSPDGNEIWIVNTTHNITWGITGSVQTVRLDYSNDAGSDNYEHPITSNITAPLGNYSWLVPDNIGNYTRVKITDTSDSTVFDNSTGNFSIKGALDLTAPDGGENWIVNETQRINWTRTGNIPNVRIEYSKNSGGTYPFAVVNSTDASTGYYNWFIPDELSTGVRIKISDALDPAVYDNSTADFIIAGKFTLTYPTGGQILYVGEGKNITWTRDGSITNAKLQYSRDGGLNYNYTITNATDASLGYSSWVIPDAIGDKVKVKISDPANTNVNDTSANNFTIKGRLNITAPVGEETYIVDNAHPITWSQSGSIATVSLSYSTDGGGTYPFSITNSTVSNGSYSWTVPNIIGNKIKVRVIDTADSSVSGDSADNFTVKGSIHVTAPNGGAGQMLQVGTDYPINWTKTGTISTVNITYSTDAGTTYPYTIIGSTDAAAGTYTWTNIPDTIFGTCKVKITNNADSSVNDTSDFNFKIAGVVNLTQPDGGERWTVNGTQDIKWNITGSMANVSLGYSVDGGGNYTTIVGATPAGSKSLAWQIPNAVSKSAKVRIADASDSDVFDVSSNNFTIQAGFNMTSPGGGEIWVVNSTHDINWTTIGSVSTVKLAYSTDGGSNYNYTITNSTTNTGSYPWFVPNNISTTMRLRVSDYNDPLAYGNSTSNFKIRGDIYVITPNNNESWIVNNTYNITWGITGSISAVNLKYSLDGGSNYNYTIASNVSASIGNYSWTIPNNITAAARVKIIDGTDSSVYDESDANFKIRGSLTLLAPNGGDVLNVGDTYNITWSKVGSIENVNLSYSTDNGLTYPNYLATLDATGGMYPWAVNDSISRNIRVKVSDSSDPIVNDTSDSNVTIRGVLRIISPNGNERWDVLSHHNITWNTTGSISTVNITYSTDGGASYNRTIISSIAAVPSVYDWEVPDTISSLVKVKVSNLADGNVFDVSDDNANIVGKLTLSSPDGGEVWAVGSSQTISWTKVGSFSNITLSYSANGGIDYNYTINNGNNVSAGGGSGSYSWDVPDVVSTTLKVKVANAADPVVNDTSNATFKIRGDLDLTRPDAPDLVFLIGSTENINWVRHGSIANAKLRYSTDGGATYPYCITNSVNASNETLQWSVPDRPTLQGRVNISDAADSTVFDTSTNNFIIRGGFVVNSPNGGEAWAVNSTHDINWTTYGSISYVRLDYSTNNGTGWTLITTNTSNINRYSWTIPDAISTNCRVKVSDVNDPDAYDFSNTSFKIHGILGVSVPNGGEQWQVGSYKAVNWTRTGSIGNVRIEYSTNGFANETLTVKITNNTPSSALTYNWTVPSIISDSIKIRVSDDVDTLVNDTSDGPFKIKASFTLSSPNGAEEWIVASAHNITWTTLGPATNIKLSFSSNSGSSWSNITAGGVNNTGSFLWTIPNIISTNCTVKVEDSTDSDAADVSDGNFKIRGDLRITAPNGGEKLIVNTSDYQITWNITGSISTVGLQYSINNGTSYLPITTSAPNFGYYTWLIPNVKTTLGLVKIYNTEDPGVLDVSDAVFKIQGSFALNTPNGGESWPVATVRPINWTWTGPINYVKLEYSKDGGNNYNNTIIASVNNTGNYNWTIPDDVCTTLRLMISDVSDAEAKANSEGNFTIKAVFNISAPNGGENWLVGDLNNILWNVTGTIPYVRLMYTRNNFINSYNISTENLGGFTNVTSNSFIYNWTVPDTISSGAQLRILDPANTDNYLDSAANFSIKSRFNVTSPVAGDKWDVDSVQQIRWTWTGSVPEVRLQYSINGGTSYSDLDDGIYNTTINPGYYNWTVPDNITASLKVKVADLADSTANDTSDGNAKIRAKFTLFTPNGGQDLTVNDTYNITWESVGTVSFVNLTYSLNNYTSYSTIITSTPNDGCFTWTVPDAISNNVTVRVRSTSDIDAYNDSNTAFRIKGSLNVTSPNGNEQWKINQKYNVTWDTIGTIPVVKILYSTNGGNNFNGTIISGTANTGIYEWTIPDIPTTGGKVRVIDYNDSAVYDDSNANFSIQGNVILDSPLGNEIWIVGSKYNITWTWGGTIPAIYIAYSNNSGANYAVVNAAAPNGAGSSGTHTYEWTIPDDITTHARVRIQDANDTNVNSTSASDFYIRGNLTITSPNGGEYWVARSSVPITWGTVGTIPNVKLQYSKDNVNYTTITNAANISNQDSFTWAIPNDPSATVKIKISDTRDANVTDTSDTNFTIGYYNVTWNLKDLLTGQDLSQLTVNAVSNQGDEWKNSTMPDNPNATLGSPVSKDMPFGFWTATWTKTGYSDIQTSFLASSNMTVPTLFMETSAIHIWRAYSEFSYDSYLDKLAVSSWLERDGFVVTGGTQCDIYIYYAGELIQHLTDLSIDDAGFFQMFWENTNTLIAGRVYTVVTIIKNASGAEFRTPTSFSVTSSAMLQQTVDTVERMSNVTFPEFINLTNTTIVTQMQQQAILIGGYMTNQTDIINASMTNMTGLINTSMEKQINLIVGDRSADDIISGGGMVGMLQSSLSSFETNATVVIGRLQSGADAAVGAGQNLTATAQRYSWNAICAPNPSLAGDNVTISVQGPDFYVDPVTSLVSTVQPMLTIYSWDNKAVVENIAVLKTQPGLYSYTFQVDNTRFQPGKAYTYIVSESQTGGLVSGSGMVESMSVTSIAGLASAAPEAERAAKAALEGIRALQTMLGAGGNDATNIMLTLQNLKEALDKLPEQMAEDKQGFKALTSDLEDMASRLQKVIGDEGYGDLGKLLEEKLADSPTMKAIRSKTDSIKTIIELLQMLFEAKLGGMDSPVVSTSLAPGSVKFRIAAVNPSATKTQRVMIKTYLPLEVKIKDILDNAGLDVGYDSGKSMYYVYRDSLELAPKEARVFEVEVEDIWFVPKKVLDQLKEQTAKLALRLEKSKYAQESRSTANTINLALEEIAKTQADESVSRDQHIGSYRQNLETLKKIKEEIVRLEKLLQPQEGTNVPEILEKSKFKFNLPNKTTTWLIIMVIISFMGMLAGVFFFIWQGQIKSSQEVLDSARKAAFPDQKTENKPTPPPPADKKT
ncbi:MAG: hypothetical protein ABH882_07025 [Candidatus Omnitrophota bacterium]